MRGDQVGEIQHNARQHRALADKNRVGLGLDAWDSSRARPLGAGIDQRQRQHGADQQRRRMQRAAF